MARSFFNASVKTEPVGKRTEEHEDEGRFYQRDINSILKEKNGMHIGLNGKLKFNFQVFFTVFLELNHQDGFLNE